MMRRQESEGPVPWAHLLELFVLLLTLPPERRPHWTECWRLFEEEAYYLLRVKDN